MKSESEALKLFAQDPVTYVSQEAYAPEWPSIAESNILWKKRVIRTMDADAPANRILTDINGARNLASLLATAAQKRKVTIYGPADDRFTHALTKAELMSLISGRDSRPKDVTRYQISEEWIFLSKEQKLICRILAIAPLKEIKAGTSRLYEPLFWCYYPELRPFLASQPIPSVDPYIRNLDQWFEAHRFAAAVDKVYPSKNPDY
jgi:hypothetical protein